jgi:lipocalin-like protein
MQNAAAQSTAPSREELVGSWRLIAASATTPNGATNDAPYGATPSGIITYTSDGRVIMAMLSHSGRKPLSTGDRISASAEERAEAYATYFAYAGRYSLAGDKIVHHVEMASVQNWVNTDLVRIVRLEDDKLTLTTPPLSVGGHSQTTELIWQRIR